nr:MAG TPA: hypothetical protein [Caudoviricetes sp.]
MCGYLMYPHFLRNVANKKGDGSFPLYLIR